MSAGTSPCYSHAKLERRLQGLAEAEAQGACGCCCSCSLPPPLPAATATGCWSVASAGDSFAHQHELARLRRERDEAAAAIAAELRRARDTAVSEAAGLRERLDALQGEHAALRGQHAVLQTEQAAATDAAERDGTVKELERLRAAFAGQAAENQGQALRVEALECQLAVLMEAFRMLEAERLQGGRQPGQVLLPAAVANPCGGIGSSTLHRVPLLMGGSYAALPMVDPPAWVDTASASGGAELDPAERLAVSHSHMGLALRCAELLFSLGQAQRQAAAATAAAAAADEQAAGLRLLLARQQGAGSAGMLQQRLDAACRQLEHARSLGQELQRQLTQASCSVGGWFCDPGEGEQVGR